MTSPWTPEELEGVEARIKAAREGNVRMAISLLHTAARCLESEWPLPEPLRHYLIAAFYEITNITNREPVPYPTPKNLAEVKKDVKHIESPRDANAALNLKRRRGRNRSHFEVLSESLFIDAAVNEELRSGGKSVEKAVEAVADKMDISDRKVARARRFWKQETG